VIRNDNEVKMPSRFIISEGQISNGIANSLLYPVRQADIVTQGAILDLRRGSKGQREAETTGPQLAPDVEEIGTRYTACRCTQSRQARLFPAMTHFTLCGNRRVEGCNSVAMALRIEQCTVPAIKVILNSVNELNKNINFFFLLYRYRTSATFGQQSSTDNASDTPVQKYHQYR
jgi:hypothetical protein